MPINLASRLSAITTDFAGVNHIVWVEDNAIWHAQFDANAGTWVNAQRVVEGVTGNVTALNLVANEKLIGGSSPGLAVIWQDGVVTQNGSNFYYSAAQYGSNGQLQWDATPTTLTVNETTDGLPFANLAPQVIADNNGNITVVGQQVNVINAVDQAIREDVDLYTASLTIDAVTPGTPTALTSPYNPSTIVDGVNQGPGIPINQSTDTVQTASQTSTFSSISEASADNLAPATASFASASSDSSGFQGVGFQFGPSLSFNTDLIEALGLNQYLFGIPLHTVERTLKQYELAGTLSGTTNFSSGIELVSKGDAVRNNISAEYEPWQVRPKGYERTNFSVSLAYDSKAVYQYTSPYNLVSIEDSLSLTANETIPIFNKPEGLIAGKITLTGSVGIGASLILEPINPADTDSVVQILSLDLGADLFTSLVTALAAQKFGGDNELAASLIASAVFEPIENLLIGNLTDAGNLQVTNYLVGPTIGATINGQFFTDAFPLLKFNSSGGVTLLFAGSNEGETTQLGIPISTGVSLGPLQVNLSIDPKWSWPTNPPLPNSTSTSTASSFALSSATAPVVVASAATTNTTATVAGTLLTLNFDAPLNINAIPSASDFTIQTQSLNQSAPSVGGVLVSNDPTTGNGVVVLQLSQPIAYSPQFTGTNPQPAGNLEILVSYNGTALEYSDNTLVSDFSNLSVTNNSPQNLTVAFNPVSGNSNNYSTQNQTTLLNNLEADYAQDSPPALTLVSSSTNTEGQVLAVWSREVQPLTPIAGFVNSNEVYLNFVQELNTSSVPGNSQFTVLVNGSASNLTVTNVAIAAGGYIQLNLSGSVASTDVVSITYQPSVTNPSNNLFLTDAVEAQLWIPAFSETLTNATGQSPTTAPTLLGGAVIIDNGTNTPNNLVTLIFDGLLNTEFIPDGSAFTVVNNSQTYTESISNVTVSGNVVTFNLPAPAQTPLISQGDITVVTYTPGSVSDQNLTGANGAAITPVSTTLITLPETPTTTLMAGFYTPGSTGGLTHFQNIPGADNFNLDPAVASDTNGNALAVWVYANSSDIDNLTVPGQFYTDDQTQVILNNLNQSDIYFSYWNGFQWTIATPLATNQPGTDSNVTVGYDPSNNQYIAAWLNANNGETTIYWASYNPTQKAWSSVNQILSEATPDPLADLVISSVNGEPALFWTQTQPVSYRQLTQEENPAIYLRLGELSGTTAKNSGNLGYTANGTYNGSVTLRETGALYDSITQSGDPNPAALFENGGSVTLNSAINTSGSAFSVEFWFKIPDAVSATTNLINLDGVFSVVLNNNGTLTFGLDNNSSITTSASTTPIEDNTWYYVVGTYTNQTQELSLYFNGQPVQTVNGVNFTLPASAALTIAGGTDAVYLDEIALYGNALSYSAQPTSGEDITGLTLLDSIFGADQIGTKYGTQYVDPLPPGPQTQFSLLQTTGLLSGVGEQSQVSPALISNNGIFYLASVEPGSNQIYLSTSPDGGQTWSNPLALPSEANSSQSPALAFYEGNLYLAYVGADNQVYITASATHGQTWSTPYTLGLSAIAGISLSVYQGQLMAFYGNSDSELFYGYSSNPSSSGGWSVGYAADNQTAGSTPSATALNNTLYLTTRGGTSNSPSDIYSLLTSEAPQNTSVGESSNISPALISNNGTLYLAYVEEENGQIYLATSTDEGQTWSSPVALLNGVTSTKTPALTFYNGSLYLAYVNAGNEIYLTFSTNNGQTWNTPFSLGQSSTEEVSLAVYQGALMAFFVSEEKAKYIFSANPQSSTAWSTAYDVSNAQTSNAISSTVFGDALYLAFQKEQGTYEVAVSAVQNTATGQSSNNAPALAYNIGTGDMYMAYIGENNRIYVLTSSNQGETWSNFDTPDIFSSQSPALAYYDGVLYLAYVGTDNEIYITSPEGRDWSTPYSLGQSSIAGVSLGVYQEALFAFFVSQENGDNIQYVYSINPESSSSWSTSNTIANQTAGGVLSSAVFGDDDILALAFQGGDVNNANQTYSLLTFEGPTNIAVGETSSTTPAFISNNGTFYLAYTDTQGSDNQLYFATSTDQGQTWSSPLTIANASTTSPPALAFYDNTLYLAYNDTNNIIYLTSSTNNGQTWSTPLPLSSSSAGGVSLTVYQDELYLFFPQPNNEIGYISSSNPASAGLWSMISSVGNYTASDALSAAVLDNNIYLAYLGEENGQADDSYFVSFLNPNVNLGQESGASPALISNGNVFYLAYQENNGDRLYFTTTNEEGIWQNPVELASGITTKESPALAFYEDTLYLAYVGTNGQINILFSENNGQNWSPQLALETDSSIAGVSLVVYQNQLMAFFVNENNKISYVFSQNPQFVNAWSPAYTLPSGIGAETAVSTTVLNDTLYVAYQGASESSYSVAATNSTNLNSLSWNDLPQISSAATNANTTPSLTNNGNQLYFTYANSNNELSYLTSNNGTNWSEVIAVSGAENTSKSPSATVLNGFLYLGYTEGSSDNIYLVNATGIDPIFSTWTQVEVGNENNPPGAVLSAPSIVTNGDQLYLAGGANIAVEDGSLAYFTSSNGVDWSGINPLLGSGPGDNPSLMVSDGDLYLGYTNQGNEINIVSDFTNVLNLQESLTNVGGINNGSTAPGLAADVSLQNAPLYLTYTDSNNELYYLASSNGSDWSNPWLVGGAENSINSPSPVVINNQLYLGYTGTAEDLFSITNFQLTGLDWSQTPIEGTSNGFTAPSITNNGNQLYLVYGDDNNGLYYLTSNNGQTWSNELAVNGAEATALTPSLTVADGILYVGYTNTTGDINLVSGFDLASLRWTQADVADISNGFTAPGLTNDGNQLYFTYGNSDNELYYLTSSDGQTWSAVAPVGENSSDGPSPAILDGRLYVGYINSEDQIYIASLEGVPIWNPQTSIFPIPFIQPTQLSDANIPVVDVVSSTTPSSTDNIYPNGQQDTVFSTTISGQQGKIIDTITLTLSNGITYSVGGSSTYNQLGVIVGNTLINSPAPNATLAYPIMGASLTLNLLVDTGAAPSASITANSFTITFTDGTSYTASLPQFVPPNSVPIMPGNVPVIGTATVTETEDSSLTLIDSGFVINTTNPGMGYTVVSADFDNNGMSDVAVGNRGYANTSGAVLNNGTIQILKGGKPILLDNFTSPLSPPTSDDSSSSTSGNTGGISIVGIPDGGQTNGQFPLSMATGDVNNDGNIDLIIGSPNNSTVYVIYGSYLANTSAETVIDVASLTSAQGYVITTPNGTTSGDLFGFAVTVGNFNGSGGADIAIGAPNASNGQGEVYVAYNGSTSVSQIYTGSSYTNSSTGEIIGEQAGYALATSAYVSNGASTFSDSTSTDDLIIGAPDHMIAVNNSWTGLEGLPSNTPNPFPTSTPVNVGAVYVFTSGSSGLESSPSYTYLGTDANTPSTNGAAQSLLAGSALASGDWNGDGYMDLAITAPGGDSNQGTVYVLSGKTASASSNVQYLNQVSNLTIEGGLPLGQAGAVVMSAGDVNDDGYTDLLITAPQGANGTGQGYVLFGQSEFLGTAGTTILDLNVTATGNKATFLLNGNFPYQLTGQAASAIGDINNDGVDDLMITAPNAQQLYAVYGHPWLADEGSIKLADISGNNGFVIDGTLYSVANQTLTGAGNNVVMVGDINGDGFADVMAGGSSYGAVVTFGSSTQDLLDAAAGTDELIITIANNGLIQTVLAAGDFNGDGLADFGVVDQNNNFYLILGNANLGPQQTLTLSTSTNTFQIDTTSAVAVGDYNGDGYDDLLLTVSGNPWLYKGNSSGDLSDSVNFASNGNTVFNGIGDVNGDGFADVGEGDPNGNQISPVSTVANGQGSLYLGNASASSSGSSSLNPPAPTLSANLTNVWDFYTSNSDSSSLNNSLSGQQIDQAPAFAVYNGYLYMAYPGNDSDTLWVQRSADGYNWEGLTNFSSDFETYSTFSLTVYNDTLYLAFTATNNDIIVTPATADSSSDLGITFDSSNSVNINQTSPTGIAPTLAVYDNELYVFFVSNDKDQNINYVTSTDGTTWPALGDSTNVTNSSGTVQQSGDRLGVAVDGDTLYVSFIGNGNDDLNLATYDGTSWSSSGISGQSSNAGPSLLYVDSTLYNFFESSSSNDEILYITLADGETTWSSPASAVPGQTTNSRPDLVYFQESIFVGFAGTGSSQAINILTSNPIYEANQTQQFGDQLQPIGDFNGDGIADFAVLAPGFFSNLGSWNQTTPGNNETLLENNKGAVLIYYGSSNGFNSSSNPDVVLGLPAPNDSTNATNNQVLLLTQLAPMGDINGDGYDDLIVASPTTALNNQNTQDGTAFVVFGGGNDLWDNTYPATSPFNLGNLTPNVSQLTLYFSTPLNTVNLPAATAFTVTNDFGLNNTIKVQSVFSSNPNELTLTLASDANISNFLSVTYTKPSSGTMLTYATGTTVSTFTASNDAVIATLGAPIIEIETYPQYGFSITGLPNSQAGISLDGSGDVNGDGFSDFLIGAPGDSDNLTYTIFGSDFLNTVNQTGTIGDDSMQGSPTGENFVAGQGDDLIVTGGGTDVVYAGPGDDQVIVNDVYFRRLDGGPGVDVLFFHGYNGQAWDLTTLSPGTRLRDFEILVTEGYGANTLTLNSLSVTQISPTNALTVILDNTDSLVLSSDFSYTGLVYQYNRNFWEYQSSTSAATVLVNQVPGNLVTFNAPDTNSPTSILPTENNTTVTSTNLVTNNSGTENFVISTNPGTENATTMNNTANGLPTQIYVSNPTVSERTGRAEFTLTRTGDLSKYVWFDYYTKDGDAKAGDRYTPVAGQAVFAPGETTFTVTVPIPNNGQYVGSRQFGLAVTLEGETTDPNLVPDAWNTTIASPKEQIRRWTLIPEEEGNSVAFDVTSTHSQNRIVTLDMELKGTVIPLVWNPTTFSYDNLPFSNVNGIAEFQDINGDLINDLYRLKFQDGGPFDGDRRVNGLVALDFELAQLKPIDVPSTGGRTEGTEGNDYLNAQNSTRTNRLEGLGGMDVLIGSPQRDILLGGNGNDRLYGKAGVDQLYGEAGNDLLDGGRGLDFLYGGAGADNFVLRAGDGPDRVMDFNAADGDLFLLDNLTFGNLSFNNNQILLGTDILAIAIDATGQPVTDFANHPQWFATF